MIEFLSWAMTKFKSRLSTEQWAEIRKAWEADKNATFAAIARAQTPPISAQSISKKAKREHWRKRTVFATGRPTDYRPEFDEQAQKLALLGATDKQLADFFNIAESTLNNWKNAHYSFLESLREGKMAADTKVAEALYLRAIGYSHPDMHIAVVDGEIVKTVIVKHYPPDTAACIFWLKNRQPQLWKEKVEVKEDVSLSVFPSKEKLDAIYEKAMAEAEENERRIVHGRAERLGIDLSEFGVGHD